MIKEFPLPDLGEGLTESEIVAWRVQVGDHVELNQIIAEHCGRPVEDIERDSDRDHWLSAHEAVEYGLVDQVLVSKKELPDAMASVVEGEGKPE